MNDMGAEAQCTCTWQERSSSGKAQLETDHIAFRGDFRLTLQISKLKAVKAVDGKLRFDSPEGAVSLDLGSAAQRWADKILNPPRRIDKLGVKAGSRVCLIDCEDADFLKELTEVKAEVIKGKAIASSDFIFLGAESRTDLRGIAAVKQSLKPTGAIWVVYPKGVKVVTEADVRAAGLNAGLVDVKVVKFSDELTGLKFVIPVGDR